MAGRRDGRAPIHVSATISGDRDRLPVLAADLVKAKVDVIVASSTAEVAAAKQATVSIPIVMWLVPDPVGSGLVGSLAHPGGIESAARDTPTTTPSYPRHKCRRSDRLRGSSRS